MKVRFRFGKSVTILILIVALLFGISSASFATNSPYTASVSTMFNSNEAFAKLDKTNNNMGASFDMHYISTVTISGTIWAYYIKLTPAGKMGIGLAKSTNGTSWTDNGLVLDVGSSGQWDDNMASFPGIWYDSGTFYLVYEGTGNGSAGDIGLATSTNGTSFTRQGRILTHNTSGWESANIGTPSLYKVGSTWYLFYHGYDWTDCRVGVATGTSLTSLSRNGANPIINTSSSGWDSGTVGKRDIIYENGYYYMVYEGSTDAPFGSAKWSSGLARSSNLISWSKYSQNPVLPQTQNYYGNDGPAFITVSGVPYIYYRGVVPGGGTSDNHTRRARIANELNGGITNSWEAESLQHVIGRQDADGWSADTGLDSPNYMQYGPYTTVTNVGQNTAVWKLMVDNNNADNLGVVTLEVVDASDGGALLASRTITRQQFSSTWHYEFFTVPFYLDSWRSGHQLEYRTLWHQTSYVREDKVGVN